MDMVMEIDILDYLDVDGEPTELACKDPVLFSFLKTVVETASEYNALPMLSADIECSCTVQGDLCLGEIEVWIYADDNRIGWECMSCGDEGVISNWEDTPWDKRIGSVYH
jgi:hypothetical protein